MVCCCSRVCAARAHVCVSGCCWFAWLPACLPTCLPTRLPAYAAARYASCDSVSTLVEVEHFVREYDMQYMSIGEGLQCDDADSDEVMSVATPEDCAFLCLADAACVTFSWGINGPCRHSNDAAQCTAETNSSAALYLLTECAFFQKGSVTETDVFHAIVPSHSELFGTVAPFNQFSALTDVQARTAWEVSGVEWSGVEWIGVEWS